MKNISYNKEFQIATAQIIDVFNNIQIARYDKNGDVNKTIDVPIKYGSRSRVLKSLENRNKTIKLPIMAISISGISRNAEKMHSLNDGILYQDESNAYDISKNTAIPITVGYSLSILTKYHQDMDQILSTIISNFRPFIYVVWPHPYASNGNLKSKITWDGSITVEYPDEIDDGTQDKIQADMNFDYHTYIFPGIGTTGDTEGPVIHNINLSTADVFKYVGGTQFDTDGIVEELN